MANKVGSLLTAMGKKHKSCTGTFAERVQDSRGSKFGISIHADAFSDPEVKGYHIITYPGSQKGYELAVTLEGALERIGAKKNRSIWSSDKLAILRDTAFPTILIELGFLTNDIECRKLYTNKWQWNLALAIVSGVLEYDKNQTP